MTAVFVTATPAYFNVTRALTSGSLKGSMKIET